MLKRHLNHKQRHVRRKYRHAMASLATAALLSSAIAAHPPTAKAAEAPKAESPGSDFLSDMLLKSRDEIEARVKDAIAQKAGEAIDAVKSNPELVNQAIDRSKQKLQEVIKNGIQEKVLEKKGEIEQALGDKLLPKQSEAHSVFDVTATAYTSGYEDNGKWNDKTHIGTKVRPGIIAVDPKVIPLGSKVYIEFPDGKGLYAVAEDTGGAIKGKRIDIALENRDKVKNFGIQDVKVHVLERGTIA